MKLDQSTVSGIGKMAIFTLAYTPVFKLGNVSAAYSLYKGRFQNYLFGGEKFCSLCS